MCQKPGPTNIYNRECLLRVLVFNGNKDRFYAPPAHAANSAVTKLRAGALATPLLTGRDASTGERRFGLTKIWLVLCFGVFLLFL